MRMGVAALAAIVFTGAAAAADLSKIDRTVGKEPKYRERPQYCLLVFGAEAKDRVWLVRDGDTLYVDRNGNGDLTEADEKIAVKVNKDLDPKEYGFSFEISDLRVGGRTHKFLLVGFIPLRRYADDPDFKHRPDVKAAFARDAKGFVVRINVDVDSVTRKGGGFGGRVSYLVGLMDLDGVLQFADSPAAAPIIHLDGPWEITFYAERPDLRLGREFDMVLVAGTPGHGPGTFAMAGYEGTIPENVRPKVEITFPGGKPGDPPLRELYELKERC